MSWNQSVFSSNVQSVGFEESTGDMTVTWKNGKISAYAGVPEDTARQVANAPSVTTAINSMVKGVYRHRYVS